MRTALAAVLAVGAMTACSHHPPSSAGSPTTPASPGSAMSGGTSAPVGPPSASRPATSKAPGRSTAPTASVVTVLVTEDPTFGRILIDAAAHPLYWDRRVPAGTLPPCDSACARAWAPILVPAGHTVSGGTALPTLGAIARGDGTRQVTFDGYPLFRYLADPASGAVTGNGAMSGWRVATA